MGKTINFEDVSEGTYVKYTFLSMNETKLKSYYGVIDKKHIDNMHVDVRWFNHEYHTFEQPMAYKLHIDTFTHGDWELVDNHSERG